MLEQYLEFIGQNHLDQLWQLAEPLKHIKIVHINSTKLGGGVAEILTKFVPISQSLGIETHWEIIIGTPEFFTCTKGFHNAIQGNKIYITSAQYKVYEEITKLNAERLKDLLQDADIVVIHDPQPLQLIAHFPNRKGKWIWRCHIDASMPFRPVWKYLQKYIELYDATIFSLKEFTQPLSKPMFIIPPSIDPLSDKNIDLDESEKNQVYPLFGIDPERPMLLQVSRFDRFKDPIGVIEAFRLTKKYYSEVQLVLAGSEASDDPEGELILQEVRNAAMDNPDIKILLLPPDAHRTINSLQRAADIIVQKSIREGFGLTVTEALWKGKPIIAGNAGGIRLQIIHGQTGFIVNTPEGAAYRMRYLLQHPETGIDLGERGREYVREKFLITRQLTEYLTLIYSLLYAADSDRIEIPAISRVSF